MKRRNIREKYFCLFWRYIQRAFGRPEIFLVYLIKSCTNLNNVTAKNILLLILCKFVQKKMIKKLNIQGDMIIPKFIWNILVSHCCLPPARLLAADSYYCENIVVRARSLPSLQPTPLLILWSDRQPRQTDQLMILCRIFLCQMRYRKF